MRILGVVPCVGFAAELEVAAHLWATALDSLLIVTHPDDEATQEVAFAAGADLLLTSSQYADGADFNKAAMLDDGVAALETVADDWILCVDADVAPLDGYRVSGWRSRVVAAVEPGTLYGARRRLENGSIPADEGPVGFFLLWNAGDAVAQERPLFGSWRNAAGYDTLFASRWSPERRCVLPLELLHLGHPGRHWCGRGRPERMQRMWQERHRLGGWAHECLCRPAGVAP